MNKGKKHKKRKRYPDKDCTEENDPGTSHRIGYRKTAQGRVEGRGLADERQLVVVEVQIPSAGPGFAPTPGGKEKKKSIKKETLRRQTDSVIRTNQGDLSGMHAPALHCMGMNNRRRRVGPWRGRAPWGVFLVVAEGSRDINMAVYHFLLIGIRQRIRVPVPFGWPGRDRHSLKGNMQLHTYTARYAANSLRYHRAPCKETWDVNYPSIVALRLSLKKGEIRKKENRNHRGPMLEELSIHTRRRNHTVRGVATEAQGSQTMHATCMLRAKQQKHGQSIPC